MLRLFVLSPLFVFVAGCFLVLTCVYLALALHVFWGKHLLQMQRKKERSLLFLMLTLTLFFLDHRFIRVLLFLPRPPSLQTNSQTGLYVKRGQAPICGRCGRRSGPHAAQMPYLHRQCRLQVLSREINIKKYAKL